MSDDNNNGESAAIELGDGVRVYTAELTDFQPDPENPNAGTERGAYMTRYSAERYGAARSLTSDKNNRIPAGNHMHEAFVDRGFGKTIVVETDGRTPVIVKRTDWDLDENDGNNPAREYSYIDNQSTLVGVRFDPDRVRADEKRGVNMTGFFRDFERDELTGRTSIDLGFEPGETEHRGMKALAFFLYPHEFDAVEAVLQAIIDAGVDDHENQHRLSAALVIMTARYAELNGRT